MPEAKKIMVGIPMHKSEVHSQVIHSVIMGGSDVHEVDVFPMGLSLLAKNFNLLWIKAYQRGYDFFILHHSDLGVVGNVSNFEGSWSDLLVQRMLELEAAAMCPVIDIKSDVGLTSTAIELEAGNPFSLRRLTKRELARCPVDYISRSDVCEVMGVDEEAAGAFLINTGCLIVNLKDFPWATVEWEDDHGNKRRGWPGFGIHDTIEWNSKGKPESYTIPEDWAMSRFFHYKAKQFPYYATKELCIAHLGGKAWLSTEQNTGQPTDSAPQQVSIEEYRAS